MLPLWARVDLEQWQCRVTHIPKRGSNIRTFTIRLFSVIPGHWFVVSYPSAEMQSVNSTARTDWAVVELRGFADSQPSIRTTVYYFREDIYRLYGTRKDGLTEIASIDNGVDAVRQVLIGHVNNGKERFNTTVNNSKNNRKITIRNKKVQDF